MKIKELDVIKFIKSVKKVYIYGTGVVATSIYKFFSNQEFLFEGFIISAGELRKGDWKEDKKVFFYVRHF